MYVAFKVKYFNFKGCSLSSQRPPCPWSLSDPAPEPLAPPPVSCLLPAIDRAVMITLQKAEIVRIFKYRERGVTWGTSLVQVMLCGSWWLSMLNLQSKVARVSSKMSEPPSCRRAGIKHTQGYRYISILACSLCENNNMVQCLVLVGFHLNACRL